jgi:hypothetical protein
MMDLDVKTPPKKIIEILRERIAELEDLEETRATTPDTCEELVDLQALLYQVSLITTDRPILLFRWI